MSHLLNTTVFLAPVEDEDFDFMTVWVADETRHFAPVQLKELVPADLNPDSSLIELSASLQRYLPTDSVLAIYLNRRLQIPSERLDWPDTPFRETWFVWCCSADQQRWILRGPSGALEFDYTK